MPATPGTTYNITHWQCCSCVNSNTDPAYREVRYRNGPGTYWKLDALSYQNKYNRLPTHWESDNPSSFNYGNNAYVDPHSQAEICSRCRHKRCVRNCRNVSEVSGSRGSVTYKPLGLCLDKAEETYNANIGTETDVSQAWTGQARSSQSQN
jgi:hypothetical protein